MVIWDFYYLKCCFSNASLAQSVERETFNLNAAGSSPVGGFFMYKEVKANYLWVKDN